MLDHRRTTPGLLGKAIEKYHLCSRGFLNLTDSMDIVLKSFAVLFCPQLARVCYVYFLSKFVEYLDTVSASCDVFGFAHAWFCLIL